LAEAIGEGVEGTYDRFVSQKKKRKVAPGRCGWEGKGQVDPRWLSCKIKEKEDRGPLPLRRRENGAADLLKEEAVAPAGKKRGRKKKV